MPVDHESNLTVAPSSRLRQLARRALRRLGQPYASQRAREAETAASLARLRAELDHVSKRHGEQIERLEELSRELILAAESLRRQIAADARHGDG